MDTTVQRKRSTIFAKLPAATTVEDIEMLLPWNITKSALVN